MPIEVGRKLTPEEEARMLAEVTLFRDIVVALAELLAPENQSDDAPPTEPAGATAKEA